MSTTTVGVLDDAPGRAWGRLARQALDGRGGRVDLAHLTPRQALPGVDDTGPWSSVIQSVREGGTDVAVVPVPQLPTALTPDLRVAAVLPRLDARDAFLGERGLADQKEGGVVASPSPLGAAMVRAFRPDLHVVEATDAAEAMAWVRDGSVDGAVAPLFVVRASGGAELVRQVFGRTEWVTAPGQGALALLVRSGREDLAFRCESASSPETRSTVRAERQVLRCLEAEGPAPTVGAGGIPYAGGLRLWGVAVSPDGRQMVRSDRSGTQERARRLGSRVAEDLVFRGANDVLESARVPPLVRG